MSQDSPIACRLTDAESRMREATLLAQFKSTVMTTEELRDGFVFRIPGDAKSTSLVMELIAAERECCPFLTFELIAPSNGEALTLSITGPAGTKDFLKTILCNSERKL